MAWQNEEGDVEAYLGSLRSTHLAGTVDRVLDRLAEYAKAGIQRVFMHQLVHDDFESLELIGREIIPAAADL